MRVAVVGAGVMGCSMARALALRGAEVTLIDADAPGAGTSSTTFAWVNAHRKSPRSYHDLNVAGVLAHHRLQAAAGNAMQWFVPSGNIEWDSDPGQHEHLVSLAERLLEWDYPVARIERSKATELAPDVRFPRGVEFLFYPTEGYVLPWLLLARMLGEAQDHGTTLRLGTPVAAIESDGPGAAIRWADNTSERFDTVVMTVGRWTEPLLAASGYALPMTDAAEKGGVAVGYLAWSQPGAFRIPTVITAPEINVRPDGGGRLVLQALDLDVSADPAEPPAGDGEVARTLRRRFAELVRGGDRLTLTDIRVGQRAMPADGVTAAGFVDNDHRIYVVATHSGITLGPLIGELAASEITAGTTAPLLEDFRPTRFTGRSADSLPQLVPARRPGEQ